MTTELAIALMVVAAALIGWRLGRRSPPAGPPAVTWAPAPVAKAATVHLPELPHVALVETDAQGLIVACNIGVTRLLGYDRTALHQRPVTRLFDADALHQLQRTQTDTDSLWDTLLQTGGTGDTVTTRDWLCRREDGSPRTVSLAILTRPGASGYLFALVDVTQARASIDTLRFSQRLVNSTFDVSSQGLAIINASGRLIRANPALTDLLGHSRHELLSRDLFSLMTADQQALLEAALRRTHQGEAPGFQLDIQLIHKTGHPIPVLLNGTRVLLDAKDADTLVVHFFDLSERVARDQAQAEEALLRESILSNIVDAIITIDESGTITSFNPAASRMFQWSVNEILGQNIRRLMPEPYKSEHDGYLHRHLAKAGAPISRRARKVQGLRRNGEIFDLELSLSELVMGEQRRFIGVLRDITDQRRIERLKDELVSVVSHELRTPLTTIYGALSLMHSRALGELPDTAHELIQASLQNAERMKHLIDDLLDMDKLAAGKMAFDLQSVELAKLLRQVMQLIQADCDRKRLTIDVDTPKQVVRVKADPKRLEQVIINLLSNAIKFSNPGQRIQIRLTMDAHSARIAVIDQGPGIPASAIDKLFTRFTMAHSAADSHRGGTGLGLAISKAIIEQLHGDIGVHSVEGQGSEFYFTLPLLGRADQDHQG